MKSFYPILLILFLFVLSQCKKDHASVVPSDNPYGLPNATQTGADMFACRYNGMNWISKTDITHLGASVINDTLHFDGGRSQADLTYLGFFIKDPQMGQTYTLNNYSMAFALLINDPCLGRTLTEYSISGSITITKYDVPNMIVSGTFDCVIPVPQCDTLKITDGRFDIKFHY